VGGLEYFLFSIIYGIILPIDKYFSRWLKPPTSYISSVARGKNTLPEHRDFEVEEARQRKEEARRRSFTLSPVGKAWQKQGN